MSQSKTIGLFAVAVIITALIVGGVVYSGQQKIVSQKEEEAKQTQQKIADLETQLAQFQQAQQSQTQDQQNKLQVPAMQDWKTYSNKDLGVDMMYPDTLFAISEDSSELYHQMQNFRLKSDKDGVEGDLAKDIQISFDQKSDQDCKYLAKNMKDSGVAFNLQTIKGVKYDAGVEGKGVVSYCIQDNKGKDVMMIKRSYIAETYSQDLAKETDYINSTAQAQLFDLMLQTVKIKNYDVSGLTYENEKYKFALKFPQAWTGYTVKESQVDLAKNGKADSIGFAFATDESLLNVVVFTKAQWTKVKADTESSYEVIKEGSKYVFAYSTATNAKDADKAKLDLVKEIVASFELK